MGMTGDLFEGFSAMVGNNIEWVGSMIGYLVSQGYRDEARKMYEAAVNQIAAEQLPAFKELVAQEIEHQQPVEADASVREAQLGALRQMQGIANEGGMDAESRAAFARARQEASANAAANMNAALGASQRRGTVDSGQMLAAQLVGGQAAANRASDQYLQENAAARRRAMEAISQSGQLASGLRSADFQQDEANRRAAMERAQFNAKMRDAAARGNNDLMQRRYENSMSKTAALNAARGMLYGHDMGQADRIENAHRNASRSWNKKGQAAGRTIGEAYDMYKGGGSIFNGG